MYALNENRRCLFFYSFKPKCVNLAAIVVSLFAIKEVMHLHFQSKQSASTPKKTLRLSRQVSLEKRTLKHISVNEKAMQNR